MIRIVWALLVALVLAGCGGGGFGTSYTVTGLVVLVGNGQPPSPGATVQIGERTINTATDGSFSLSAPAGTTSLLITYTPTGTTTPVAFRFDFPALTANTDLGDFVIGPNKISVAGVVRSTADNSLLSGVLVRLAGRTATTNASGQFSLADVAYDPASAGGFLGLEGRAGRSGFFTRAFNPDAEPVGGVATISDVLLQPDLGDAPPGTPFTLEGIVGPADATGATVEILNGASVIRRQTVAGDRRFSFWLPVGTYTIRAFRPANPTGAGTQTVTLTSPIQSVRRDVTIP